MYADRTDAARQLAVALAHLRGRRPLVLAIPRGAVEIGAVLARELQGDLDIVLVRKLGAPFSPEYAIGAVDESGWTYVAPHAKDAGAGEDYIEHERRQQLAVLRDRRQQYTPGRGMPDVAGRTVIVVDDGLATGATMLAALHAVSARGAAHVVCAAPVASDSAVQAVRAHCDELVCPLVPPDFRAVGQFYRRFEQVDDDEVVRLLKAPAAPHP